MVRTASSPYRSICGFLVLAVLSTGARVERGLGKRYLLAQDVCDVEDGTEKVVSVAA